MSPTLENFYLQKKEPDKSCLLALRDIILHCDKDVTETMKYGMPFFCYKGKMFCYLWMHKKWKQPYIGMVEGKRLNHPDLIEEKRSRMAILLIDANKDLPVKKINDLLHKALMLYKRGIINLK